MGALPCMAMLTLGCLSTIATNETDPGVLAHAERPPWLNRTRTNQGLKTKTAVQKRLYMVKIWRTAHCKPADITGSLCALFWKDLYFSVPSCECVHMLAVLCAVCAVPQPALLLVSGVLECWKHLAGRINIQLTGSQTSYITAENPPPHLHPSSSLYPGLFPIRCPSPPKWSLHPSPLSMLCCPQSLFGQRGGRLTALQLCLSNSSPADCIWSELIVFHLEVIASHPHHPHLPFPLTHISMSGRWVPRR